MCLITEGDKRLIKEIEKYEAELRAIQPEELQSLYEKEQEKQRIEWQAEADREEAQRFFNQPGAEADFEHWSKAAHWVLDEAIALSFGKAPEVVSWQTVKGYVGISRFADQYAKLQDLALRATSWQQLYDPVLPGIFLAWAKRNEIEYPVELEKQLVARGHQIADWKTLFDGVQTQYNEFKAEHDAYAAEMQALLDNHKKQLDDLAAERDSLRGRVEELEQAAEQCQAKEKPLLTRERGTALKLIITMAKKGYGYNPQEIRSSKISEIVADLDLLGLSLDADTVRKWLQEAAELLLPESPE